jgi:Family of unknown function (DUF6350)
MAATPEHSSRASPSPTRPADPRHGPAAPDRRVPHGHLSNRRVAHGRDWLHLPVAAAVTTLWAALLSYLPVAVVMALVQFADQASTVADTARLGLAAWLLGHWVPLGTSVGPFGVAPLALTLLAGWRVARAGVHTSRAVGARRRASLRETAVVAVTVGAAYGLVGAVAAAVADDAGHAVSPLRAGATLAGFGTCAALVGAMPATGAIWAMVGGRPGPLRDGLRTGLIAALLVLGAGAGAAGLAVAVHGGDAGELIAAYRTGVAGQAGITLVSVAFAPNVAVWAAAYLLGPGFAVGADTVVRTTEVTAGVLPALPLAAGIPEGPVGGPAAALLAVPMFSGIVAGWLLVRRRLGADGSLSWSRLLGAAALSGPVAGLVLGLAAMASSGSLGGGRLAELGPIGWQVAAAATAVVGVGALLGAATARAVSPR